MPPSVAGGVYGVYQACLRLEHDYRCVYCLSHEREVGPVSPCGGFEIEHYKPDALFPLLRCTFANLFWACELCNRAKGDTWPSDQEVELGYRFLDPLIDNWTKHLRVKGDSLDWLTKEGEYTKDEIDLNSPTHEKRRRERANFARRSLILEGIITRLEARVRLGASPEDVEQLAAIREEWDDILKRATPPDDRPLNCFCSGVRPQRRRRARTRRERKAAKAAAAKSR